MTSIYPQLKDQNVENGATGAATTRHRELKHRYAGIFLQLDRDNDGRISTADLKNALEAKTLKIPEHVRENLLRSQQVNGTSTLDVNEFLTLIENTDSQAYLGCFRRGLATVAYSIIPKTHRPQFVESELRDYNCLPPPFFLITISLAELVVFLYYNFTQKAKMALNASVEVQNPLIYNPFRRREVWRLFSYMFIHAGWWHLIVNLLVQLVLGLPLELVHRYWRVGIVYTMGVAAGSLGTSVTDPAVFLAGASGGVYALIAAHLASIIINWKEMEYNCMRLVFWIFLVGTDIGVAIYYRYFYNAVDKMRIGYSAHFCGAVCGFLLGVVCLRNLHRLPWERVLWWVCLVLTGLLFIFAVLWNIFWPGFPPQEV